MEDLDTNTNVLYIWVQSFYSHSKHFGSDGGKAALVFSVPDPFKNYRELLSNIQLERAVYYSKCKQVMHVTI